jgi:hypothetical protein
LLVLTGGDWEQLGVAKLVVYPGLKHQDSGSPVFGGTGSKKLRTKPGKTRIHSDISGLNFKSDKSERMSVVLQKFSSSIKMRHQRGSFSYHLEALTDQSCQQNLSSGMGAANGGL